MSKNQNDSIENLLHIIKKPLDNDKNNNSRNIIYNEKNTSFKIKSDNNDDILDDNNPNENMIFNIYITLINLQKEKITINLKKIHSFNLYNDDTNNNLPNSIIEIVEQNNNMIRDISIMEHRKKTNFVI